jgi:hypothetical protein
MADVAREPYPTTTCSAVDVLSACTSREILGEGRLRSKSPGGWIELPGIHLLASHSGAPRHCPRWMSQSPRLNNRLNPFRGSGRGRQGGSMVCRLPHRNTVLLRMPGRHVIHIRRVLASLWAAGSRLCYRGSRSPEEFRHGRCGEGLPSIVRKPCIHLGSPVGSKTAISFGCSVVMRFCFSLVISVSYLARIPDVDSGIRFRTTTSGLACSMGEALSRHWRSIDHLRGMLGNHVGAA